MKLQRKNIRKLHKKNSALLGVVEEPHLPIYYRPRVTDHSNILREEQFEILWGWLPHRFCIRDPVLLFSTAVNGYSLNSLVSIVGENHPTLLTIRTKSKEIFGGFITVPWKRTKSFIGDRQCFLWRLTPKPEKFGWNQGQNDYFFLIANQSLQMGSDGVGLWIDHDLWIGQTTKSETYCNPPLTVEGETFYCIHLEVYTFK